MKDLEDICKMLGCKVKRDRNYLRHLRSHNIKPGCGRKYRTKDGIYRCLAHYEPLEFDSWRNLMIHWHLFHRHQPKPFLSGCMIDIEAIKEPLKSIKISLKNYELHKGLL